MGFNIISGPFNEFLADLTSFGSHAFVGPHDFADARALLDKAVPMGVLQTIWVKPNSLSFYIFCNLHFIWKSGSKNIQNLSRSFHVGLLETGIRLSPSKLQFLLAKTYWFRHSKVVRQSKRGPSTVNAIRFLDMMGNPNQYEATARFFPCTLSFDLHTGETAGRIFHVN